MGCLAARRMHTIGYRHYCVTGYLMMGAAGSKNENFVVYRAISQAISPLLLETPLICIGIRSLDGTTHDSPTTTKRQTKPAFVRSSQLSVPTEQTIPQGGDT